ncbi:MULTISPECIES: DUF3899 domain-containing protein [unclassified Paenibacillus]|uniref:DUF3899 domain-containing protein n=1 Tax=unclassified Paenibacillus TaxID=185978 RepID=UPI0009A61CB7|nr:MULTISPECIES: DUF3899 domain-containing protein [unclassified Paenibacillus]SLK19855.1 protein of unknown function [Paenibacillus sp. RU5A]SOC75944.1 protein of unknown function [Paenibacillus sp. RU26A]SOC77720.1 protein of unknown function [Paenibacillus sp. RU5M]
MFIRYALAGLITALAAYLLDFCGILGGSGGLHEGSDQLFVAGLICLLAGTAIHVLQSGFMSPFLQGFGDLKRMFVRESNALQRENERIRTQTALPFWKKSLLRQLTVYTLGGGSGLILCSLLLLWPVSL